MSSTDEKPAKRGRHTGKDTAISAESVALDKSKNCSQEHTSKDNEALLLKQSITAKKTEISPNTVTVLQPRKKTNGKRLSNSPKPEESTTSSNYIQMSTSDTLQSYLDFTSLNVHLFSTFWSMNGGLDQQEQGNQECYGRFIQDITPKPSTNGGMDTPTRKRSPSKSGAQKTNAPQVT